MYKVTYTVKNEDGFLIDKSRKFDLIQEACKFIRELNHSTKIIGRPTVERN